MKSHNISNGLSNNLFLRRALFSIGFSMSFAMAAPVVSIANAEGKPVPAKPATQEIKDVLPELKAVYDIDVKEMSTPPEENSPAGTPPEQLLSEHKLITPQLLKHLGNIGGLDFDILTSSQDWDNSWEVKFGEPVKSGANFLVPIVLDRHTEKSTVTWKFVNRNGAWLIDDATYEEPGEKPFTLRSLKEGD